MKKILIIIVFSLLLAYGSALADPVLVQLGIKDNNGDLVPNIELEIFNLDDESVLTNTTGNEGIAEIDQEVAYQQSGAVDLASAAELGKQLGAEYVFYGRFTEIRKQRSDTTAAWYKFTMNAVNVQTREIVWAEEQDIAKKETKAFIGW